MLRHPIFRLSSPNIPRVSPNQNFHVNQQSYNPSRSTFGARSFQLSCKRCDKHDIIPHPEPNLQLIAKSDSSNLTLPKTLSTPHPIVTRSQILVAMAAMTTGDSENGEDGSHPSTFNPMQNGAGDTYEKHMASLLDGLAVVCVHTRKPQVLAVAMQIDHVSKRIRLTIAGNDNVSEKVVKHLGSVWRILQDISNHSIENYSVNESSTLGQGGKESQENRSKAKDPALLWRLHRTIYQHSYGGLLSSFDTHLPELQKFAIVLKGILLKLDQADGNTAEHQEGKALLRVLNVIEYTLAPLFRKLKAGDQLEEAEWRMLCIMMYGILHDYKKHIDNDKRFCEKWLKMAKEVDKTISAKTPVQTYLQKLTLLPRHIHNLAHSARSHHLRSSFTKELSIYQVPAEHTKCVLPNTPQKWEEIIISTAHRYGYKILKPAFSKLSLNQKALGKIHCECLLVKYFHSLKREPKPKNSPWNNITPFSYIGVSKLSCQGCSSWLKAYNTLGQQSFYTKGTHSRWCFSWRMPQLDSKEEMEQIDKSMAGDTAKNYCLFQKKKGRMTLLSNGTETLPVDNGSHS